MLMVAKDIDPEMVIILGDYADFYAVSSHGKDPRIPNLLMDEVVDVLSGLQELDDLFPSAQKVFLQGNHCWRLERYLCNQAPALFGITDTKILLDFDRRPKWHFVNYGPNQMYQIFNSALWARHEPLGPTAKASAGKAMCSFVHGHTHRIEAAYSVGLRGDQHICYSPGWLGDKRKDIIFGYVKQHHQWNLGFSIVYVDKKTGLFFPSIINIIEDGNKVSCSVNGKLYCL